MKVGDYVRTKKGGIGKIVKIEPFMNKTHIFLDSKQGDITFYTNEKVLKVNSEESIIKSSSNIIDLIEAGDLVTLASPYCEKNIYKVVNAFKGKHSSIELDCFGDGTMSIDEPEEIKSIVTREMFESMEYKVEK